MAPSPFPPAKWTTPEKAPPKVKVWIGQETNQPHGTDPTTVTFYEEGEDAMETELAKIQAAFGDKPVVGGLAIHHWAAYKNASGIDGQGARDR